MENNKLPFKVGQLAEAKSFDTGYRGAWFRCKIHGIDGSTGYIRHALEYIDFPDEKKKWMKIYQLPGKKKKGVGRQLMVRPQYPCRYNEIPIPAVGMIMEATVDRSTEVTVNVDDLWKVGDLVDWWTDGCYWSGSLTQLFGNGKAKITLLQSPEGEGGSYEVYCKDLRPSLDWSPEDGWRVRTLKGEGDNCINFDRLVQQLKQGMNSADKADVGLLTYDIHSVEVSSDVENKAASPVNASLSSHISANSIPASDKSDPRKTGNMWEPLSITVPKAVTDTPEGNGLDMRDSSIGKSSLSDSVSTSPMKKYAETSVHTAGEDTYNSARSMKKLKTGGSISLNIMFSDSLHAAILDLEELANKVQWLKDILELGIPLSNDLKPPWKFVEHRASSAPK